MLQANQLLVADKLINNKNLSTLSIYPFNINLSRSRKYVRNPQPINKQKLNEIDDDPLEQWKETKIPLEDQVIVKEFIEVFQQHKKAFEGITQQIAADEVCELDKSKIVWAISSSQNFKAI